MEMISIGDFFYSLKIEKRYKWIKCKIITVSKDKRIKMEKKYFVEAIQIFFGCLIMAFGISVFLLPNQLSSGGFSGISTIAYYLFNVPIGTTMLILNIPLMIFAFFRLGKLFIGKAIIGTVLLSVFLDLFEKINSITTDRFLACIYGGIASGIGTALILKANASTGGTDLISYIIRSYKRSYKSSSLIVTADIIIIGLNVLFFKEIEIALYSAITIYIMGKIIDVIFEGIDFTKIIYIISPKYGEISIKIGEQVKRGCTGMYSKGMFTQKENLTLMCVTHRNEVGKIKEIVKQVDPTAFVIVSNAREVLGKGFNEV